MRIRKKPNNSTKAIKVNRLIESVRAIAQSFDNKMFGAMYTHAIEQYVHHKNPVFLKFLQKLIQPPVSIEEFLDSKDFMGSTDLVLWPEVRKAVIDINKDWWRGPKHAMQEAVLAGATRSGKTEIAKVTMAYHLHILGCIDKPQTIYSLPSETSIVFIIQGAKPHVTKKVVYAPLRKYIEKMPWFQKYLRPNRLIESEMYFEEQNFRVVPGTSDFDAVLGEAIVAGVLDEVNFMHIVQKSKKAEVSAGGRSASYDQAQVAYDTVTRRKKATFMYRGPQIGVICVSSSTRYKGDFTDKRKKHIETHGEKNVYVYDKAQYEVWPESRYCGEKFRVFVENEAAMDIRILEEEQETPSVGTVFEVPIEYYDDFLKDPSGALRDIVGRSVNAINPFFRRRFKITQAVERGIENGLESFLYKDNVILGFEGLPQVKQGHYCKNPSKPRYVHIDLSENGDRCVAKNEPILMGDGSYKFIQNIIKGDTVVSSDGSLQLVADTHCNGRKEVFSVSTTGWSIAHNFTDNHKLLSIRREDISYTDGRLVKPSHGMFLRKQKKSAFSRYEYKPEYRELSEIDVGDFIAIPRPVITTQSMFDGVPLNWSTGYIAGLFAAEGSFYYHRDTKYVQFSLNEKEHQIINILSQSLLDVFGVTVRVNSDGKVGGKGIHVRTTLSEELTEFCEEVTGEYAEGKDYALWNIGNRAFHAGFASGVVDGDAHVKYNEHGDAKHIKLKTIAKNLSYRFYWNLVAYGFLPVLREEEAYIDKKGIHHKKTYSVSLAGVEQCSKLFSFNEGIVNVPCSTMIGTEDYILTPVVVIKSNGITSVYDLTVCNTSSYVVGNLCVHNCGIGMIRYDGMREMHRANGQTEFLPAASVEMAVTVEPDHGNEIDIAEIRAWVKTLKTVYGYPIRTVTYDGWNSLESRQQWKKQGMITGLVSVDRNSVPYKQFREAFNDDRVDLYAQEVLITELYDLEYDSAKDKIDHPINSGKDCADSVCGAYNTMLTRSETWTGGNVDLDTDPSLAGREDLGDRFEDERAV